MTNRYQVECVNKADRMNPHERITAIGGRLANGQRWEISQERAIAGIESREWAFFVNKGGRTADVIVAVSRWGNKYIKTVADGEQPDNLLSLASCPI